MLHSTIRHMRDTPTDIVLSWPPSWPRLTESIKTMENTSLSFLTSLLPISYTKFSKIEKTSRKREVHLTPGFLLYITVGILFLYIYNRFDSEFQPSFRNIFCLFFNIFILKGYFWISIVPFNESLRIFIINWR
jgi:hypothetical protein